MIATDPPNIDSVEAVILFGSHARGDADSQSDIDICVLTDAVDFPRLMAIRNACSDHYKVPEDGVSIYTLPIAIAMARKGSLLLWHLRKEGTVLYDRNGKARRALEALEPFTDYSGHLQSYANLFRDVQEAFDRNGCLSELDLHILFIVVRNIAILLTYASGQAFFGRSSAYQAALRRFPDLPVQGSAFTELHDWHLRYARGGSQIRLPPLDAGGRTYLDAVSQLLSFARSKLT